MKSTKKRISNLSVGSKFLLSDGEHYPGQITVLSKEGDKVQVEVSIPARPEICPQCGHGLNLSVNAVTGAVVCMTTGCGLDFGYSPVKTTTVNASALVAI